MHENADKLIAHAHLFTMKGDGVGYVADGAVAVQGDLILVDLGVPNLSPLLDAPVRNIVPNLVYAGSGHEVQTVMVAGQVLMRDRKVLSLDEDAILAEVQLQAGAIARRVAADPVHRGVALLAAMEAGQL